MLELSSLELFEYITYKNKQLTDTLLKSISLTYQMDKRRQNLLDCVYRELSITIREINDIISNLLEHDVPIHDMIEDCINPEGVDDKCSIQHIFIKLVKLNTKETVNRIHKNINRNAVDRVLYINEIYSDVKELIEDIYISAAAIDVRCSDISRTCNSTSCDITQRNSTIVLYITTSTDRVSVLMDEYLNICKDVIEPMKISLIIDFALLLCNDNGNIDIDCKRLPDTIEKSKKYFKDVSIRNSRMKSVNMNKKSRDKFVECEVAFI